MEGRTIRNITRVGPSKWANYTSAVRKAWPSSRNSSWHSNGLYIYGARSRSRGWRRGRRGRLVNMAWWISQNVSQSPSTQDELWGNEDRFAALTNTKPEDGEVLTWPEADDLSEYL
jgi:hypothetical protein